MKTKVFKNIGYLLFILLSLNSCVNEMDMIENELDLETNIGRSYPADTWTKELINYEGSTEDRNALARIENLLETLYRFVPDIQYVMDNLITRGFKISITVEEGGSMESWYDPNYPPKISFNGYVNVTLERMLHELLHMFSFNTYDSYRKGLGLACEEYEIRVLTDLYMRRYFKSHSFTYQGMRRDHFYYGAYIDWLDEIINDETYDLNLFIFNFKKFGVFCMGPLEDQKININDLNNYRPLLVTTLWFYGKY